MSEKEVIKYYASCIIKRLNEVSNIIGLCLEDDCILLDYQEGDDITNKLKTIYDMSLSLDNFVEDELIDKYM